MIISSDNSLSKFEYDFNEINILEFFINNSVIQNLFQNIFILSIIFIGVFSIISILKVMINNNSSILKIVFKFLTAIISIFVVLSIIYILIIISNKVLNVFIDIFNINMNFNLADIIFDNSVGEWYSNYSITEIDFSSITVKTILGDYSINDSLIPIEWNHNGIINPDNFQYLPCLITLVLSLVSLLIVVIKIIKRIYQIILLFLTMPISLSSIPLDNGFVFKKWIIIFLKEFFVLFLTYFVINLFFFIFPIINELKIDINDNLQSIYKLIIIMGSAVFLPIGQSLIDEFIKNQNDSKTFINKEVYNNIDLNSEISKNITHKFIEEERRI